MARLFTEDEVRAIMAEATAPLLARIAELEAEVQRLHAEVARLKKDSSTSSKPPSSDIVKPPRPVLGSGKRRKRRRGGQPGHPRHTRPLFSPEQVDHAWTYEWPASEMGAEWEPLDEFRILQQVELVEKLFEVTEHRARLYRSRITGEILAAALPKDVRLAGLVGPRLTALLAFQKGACHMSYTSIQTFLKDVFGLPLSTGQIAKIIQKASAALGGAHAELEAALPKQAAMNIDETGHPENGKKLWTWGFHVPGLQGFTWLGVIPKRATWWKSRGNWAILRNSAFVGVLWSIVAAHFSLNTGTGKPHDLRKPSSGNVLRDGTADTFWDQAPSRVLRLPCKLYPAWSSKVATVPWLTGCV